MRASMLAVSLAVALGGSDFARADRTERDVDFSGGFAIHQAPSDAFESFPGVVMQARYFASEWVYLAGTLSGDLGFELRNPERGNVVPMLGLGVGAGVYRDLGSRISVFGGARGEWLNAWDWPYGDSGNRDFHTGLRGGPNASVSLRIGSWFGHAMSLEASAAYLYYRIPDGETQDLPGAEPVTHKGLAAGVFLTGVLFPEPRRLAM